jgi:O-antigen/teichoic acid export membrane protein
MAETQSRSEGLAAKMVKGSAYSIAASAVTLVLGFGRSVLMARLLAPEDFGVVAFASMAR